MLKETHDIKRRMDQTVDSEETQPFKKNQYGYITLGTKQKEKGRCRSESAGKDQDESKCYWTRAQ